MAIVSEPNEYSVEGIVETDEGNRRVVFTQGINGTQQNYDEFSVECIVEDDEGHKQRCVAVKNFGGGGGGGTDDYSDLTNKPKINNVTLSGNKTGADLGLVDDVQVNGTSIVTDGVANIQIATSDSLGVVIPKNGLQVTAQGNLNVNKASESQIDARINNYNPIVPATLDYAVRSVLPACTTITAADTTATLVANTTYAHQPATGCTYTLTTPTDLTVYSGFILMLDTTNSASIAFQTDDSPATSIVLNGNPTVQTGKRYTVTGQYSVLNNAWELWIIEYSAT